MKKLLLILTAACWLLAAGCAGGTTAAAPAATAVLAASTPAGPEPAASPSAIANDSSWAPWPTRAWAAASPEQAGMDSARLLTLLDFLPKQDLDLHSLLVIRHGYIVLEVNIFPNQASTGQELQSCTKSITSTLTGIALKDGLLTDLNQKVLDFFPGRTFANLDARKRAMTVRDLLTMSTGLDWPESTISYGSRDNPVRAMWTGSDPVQYILDRPMTAAPGALFNYNTGASQLLGAILEKTSGQKLADYANQQLFEPLGIRNFTWHSMRGIEPGGSGLVLTARDMAKLGYLYLRGGQWENRQIIPASWIAESTRKQVEAGAHGSYGYQWWLDPGGSYSAVGFGGQAIHVYPDKDLVVVITGAMSQTQRTTLRNLVDYFVLPAVISDTPLAETADTRELQTRLKSASDRPAAHPVDPLPVVAREIAGRTYDLETNSLYWKTFKLDFTENDAFLTVTKNSGDIQRIPMGLDGVPRMHETLRTLVTGEWDDERTFLLHYEILGDADGRTIKMVFEGSQVSLTATTYVQADSVQIKGSTH
jgi:CubicO group peptidase (beta-lactamase class C family)